VATKPLEVGDELLFDYNDKESSCPFLQQCPICGTQQPPQPPPMEETLTQQPTVHDTPTQPPPVKKTQTQPEEVDDGQPLQRHGKRRRRRSQHKSPKASRRDSSVDQSPLRAQRQKLLHDTEQHFGTQPLTRSMVEDWRPTLTADDISYLLLQRNMAAANVMVRAMETASSARQQTIIDNL